MDEIAGRDAFGLGRYDGGRYRGMVRRYDPRGSPTSVINGVYIGLYGVYIGYIGFDIVYID